MENIIVIVGFLGVGKTTLLSTLIQNSLAAKLHPYLILNDYENADLDAQQFLSFLKPEFINAMTGSCICCTGISELRLLINSIPKREHGITFIEANGTTDACDLMEFLGVGVKSHFAPPIQISVVDLRHWQQRDQHNHIEASQVQMSSLVVLNNSQSVSQQRLDDVRQDIQRINPLTKVVLFDEIDSSFLSGLNPITRKVTKPEHHIFHWSSCSVDLPDPIHSIKLAKILESMPKGIMRAKACTKLDDDNYYSQIEMIPSGEVYVKRYYGSPASGPKLIVVGPGSDPEFIEGLIQGVLSINLRNSIHLTQL